MPFPDLSLFSNILVCAANPQSRQEFVVKLVGEYKQRGVPALLIESQRRAQDSALHDLFSGNLIFVGQLESQFAINPLEVLQGVSVQRHIASLIAMFQHLYEMSEPVTLALEKSLEITYSAKGWNLLSGNNKRITGGLPEKYEPDLQPTLVDLIGNLEQGAFVCNFESYIEADVRAILSSILKPLVTGVRRLTFGMKTQNSIATLFNTSAALNIDALLTGQYRSLLVATLLMFASELSEHQSESNGIESALVLDDLTEISNLFPGRNASLAQDMLTRNPAEIGRARRAICYLTQTPRTPIFSTYPWDHCVILSEDSTGEEAVKKIVDRAATTLNKTASETGAAPLALRPLISMQPEFWPPQLGEDSLQIGLKIAESREFFRSFGKYLLLTLSDLTQLVHGRAALVHEVQRQSGRLRNETSVQITWVALSIAADKYFADKAAYYNWSLEEEQSIRSTTYQLLAPAFLPSDATRRLDIKTLKNWKLQLETLQSLDCGPLQACGPCPSKCQYRTDTLLQIDAGIVSDFQSIFARGGEILSAAAGRHARLLAERITREASNGLAFCLAVHLIETMSISADAKILIAHQIWERYQDPVVTGDCPE